MRGARIIWGERLIFQEYRHLRKNISLNEKLSITNQRNILSTPTFSEIQNLRF